MNPAVGAAPISHTKPISIASILLHSILQTAASTALFLIIVLIPNVAGNSDAPFIKINRKDFLAVKWSLMDLPDPMLMASLIIAESNGNPCAISAVGAMGLCQIMPELAKSIGRDPSRLMDPDYNIETAARWLGILIRRYGVDGALRAYNCGETAKHLWHTEAVNRYVKNIMEKS